MKWRFSKALYQKHRNRVTLQNADEIDGEEVEFDEFGEPRTKAHGTYVDKEWLKPMFEIGDRVRIRQWDDMAREFRVNEFGNIPCKGTFTKDMKPLCGQEFVITNVDDKGLILWPKFSAAIYTDMLEPVGEEKAEPTDFKDTYDTQVMFAKLCKNPEKQYKRTDDGLVMSIVDGKYHWGSNHRPLAPDDIWTEVEQEKEAPFMEAVSAYMNGKTIVCRRGKDDEFTYNTDADLCGMVDEGGCAICADEILNGHWFIKEAK